MLTNKTRYAIKALLALAKRTDGDPVGIADLAESEGIPKKFLELILLELKNMGILQSKKGKGGGYFLAKAPRDVMLGQVVRMIDGPLAPIPCVSKTAYHRCDDCRDETTCGLRLVMKDVRDAIAEILDSTSLQDVLDRVAETTTEHSSTIMFYI